jgi:NAD(P)-dependent dehydrogenase (short-subunit alcohol dehydrogenase family)
MKTAAEATSTITGGKLDVLINNAGLVSQVSDFKTILDLYVSPVPFLLDMPAQIAKRISSDSALQTQEDDFLESFKVNALGLVNVVHAFLPLVRQGAVKKVVNLSTGIADLNLIRQIDFDVGAPYAASKAAANIIIAKYAAALKKEGVLFLSLSPGYVSTEANLAGENAPPVLSLEFKTRAYS